MKEILQPHEKYKGSVGYFKEKTQGRITIVRTRSGRGNDAYDISSEDYEWCDTYDRAKQLWKYNLFKYTADDYSGRNVHPRTGQKYVDSQETMSYLDPWLMTYRNIKNN